MAASCEREYAGTTDITGGHGAQSAGLSGPSATASESPPALPPSAVSAVETILLAEDEAALRTVVGRALERRGYEVLLAEDGRAALELCRARTRPVDLVVTDIVMPRMNGVQLARELRDLWPGCRILFVSGYADRIDVTATRELGVGSYLPKPFGLATLAERVRAALDG